MTTRARRASRRTESSQRGIGRFYSKFQRPALLNSEYLPKTLWTALEYQTALSWGYRAITQRYPAEGLAGLFAVRALPVVSGKTHTMRSFLSTRRAIPLALAGMLFCVGAAARAQSRQIPHGGQGFHMQRQTPQQERRQQGYPQGHVQGNSPGYPRGYVSQAPIVRQTPGGPGNAPGTAQRGVQGGQRNEHLADWMNQHSNLSPAQQQQALGNEPGFRELPPETQQRMRDRLTQLNAMSPQQRDRTTRNIETMEHLAPEQRSQVRGAMEQLGSLPPDQRRMVARSFRELRELPPAQRWSAMNSPRYAGQMNDAQRATLGNLLRVEPLLPPPDDAPR